jgi:hypothetical protein
VLPVSPLIASSRPSDGARSAGGIYYKDQHGNEDREYISLAYDTAAVLRGRSPLQAYSDFFAAFQREFATYLGQLITVVEVQPCWGRGTWERGGLMRGPPGWAGPVRRDALPRVPVAVLELLWRRRVSAPVLLCCPHVAVFVCP